MGKECANGSSKARSTEHRYMLYLPSWSGRFALRRASEWCRRRCVYWLEVDDCVRQWRSGVQAIFQDPGAGLKIVDPLQGEMT